LWWGHACVQVMAGQERLFAAGWDSIATGLTSLSATWQY
jgi:hypothetical protein